VTTAKLTVLGSGSKGNATLLEAGGIKILIDAGFSLRQLYRRLEIAGCDADEIDALCCTHTHSDHVREITLRFVLKHRMKFYVHAENEEIFRRRFAAFREIDNAGLMRVFRDPPFSIGEVRVEPLRFPHDSQGVSNGFRMFAPDDNGGEYKISYVTDLGFFPEEYHELFEGSEVIVLESNHDPVMLRKSARPEVLKRRILSSTGHLSNKQALEALRRILGRARDCGTMHVVLAHLSEECNDPQIVRNSIIEGLKREGHENLNFHIAEQHEPSCRIDIGHARTSVK
jgi:phosphoribosyl 1,2-cyclic phosphodiesterase